jgi:hypothetical protein
MRHAFVDGKEIGHLTAEALLPPGNHKVLLAAANVPDKVNTVALAEGQHFDLHFPLASTNGVSTPPPTRQNYQSQS